MSHADLCVQFKKGMEITLLPTLTLTTSSVPQIMMKSIKEGRMRSEWNGKLRT